MVSEIDKRKNTVVLSLGGNIGDVKQVFKNALMGLQERVGRLDLLSSVYSTKAWGVEDQPDFLNQVIILKTSLLPDEVLRVCLEIELEQGRIRKEKWMERVIDIDVLFYNNETRNSKNLTLPHPYIQKRNFILSPLSEIIPDFVHPVLQKTMIELKKSCKDDLLVTKISR